ncbi:MAG: single-stranded-DNA-specific exonuclease RecJ, partial [Sarcina sp.]
WMLKNKNRSSIEILSKELGISQLIATLLVNRDIINVEEARRFLSGDVKDLLDGFEMKDMKKGVEKIKEAIERNKKIVIYGDYDCDGVISTTILYKGLKRCGANFEYHIPNREEEGYGMNSQRIKILKEQGFELILTCDNGITAHEEVNLANSLGMEVVLTDHHDIPLKLDEDGNLEPYVPKAYAVINPKQLDCNYKFKHLCGAGIAFKFICCLYKLMNIDYNEALKLLEFCAIATVCDVVDLVGENRIIVKEGLKMINNTSNKGVCSLIKHTKLANKTIGQYHLGFVIGPCINATGRLETADLSVELLITEDENKAEKLAKELCDLNQKRQDMTKDSVDMVINQIEENSLENDKVLMLYNPNIHESIAGIVAGRIREKYNRPTIIITGAKDMPKGSARSIEEYNMFEELSKCKELLSKFGGHPMAAGLSLVEENLPELRQRLINNCQLKDEDFIPKIKIDARVELNDLTEDLINNVNMLEPFGKGNASPLLAEKGIKVSNVRVMGKDNNILKLKCKVDNSFKTIDAITFDKFEEFKEQFSEKYGKQELLKILDGGFCNFKIDLIYQANINEFNGKKSVQMIIKSLRL